MSVNVANKRVTVVKLVKFLKLIYQQDKSVHLDKFSVTGVRQKVI
jgi:hypothetical protein